MLTREQLINSILSINPTAAVDFLMGFDTLDLRYYLERLQLAVGPRGKDSVWTRPGNTMPATSAAA